MRQARLRAAHKAGVSLGDNPSIARAKVLVNLVGNLRAQWQDPNASLSRPCAAAESAVGTLDELQDALANARLRGSGSTDLNTSDRDAALDPARDALRAFVDAVDAAAGDGTDNNSAAATLWQAEAAARLRALGVEPSADVSREDDILSATDAAIYSMNAWRSAKTVAIERAHSHAEVALASLNEQLGEGLAAHDVVAVAPRVGTSLLALRLAQDTAEALEADIRVCDAPQDAECAARAMLAFLEGAADSRAHLLGARAVWARGRLAGLEARARAAPHVRDWNDALIEARLDVEEEADAVDLYERKLRRAHQRNRADQAADLEQQLATTHQRHRGAHDALTSLALRMKPLYGHFPELRPAGDCVLDPAVVLDVTLASYTDRQPLHSERGRTLHVVQSALAPDGRRVVLKQFVLRESLQMKRRFVREISTLWRMRHPFAVEALGAFFDGDSAYLVMPYYTGGTLESWAEPRRTAAEVRDMLQRLLMGLAFVHSMGVVHCDVKPANVLMDDDASENGNGGGLRPRLGDFELSLDGEAAVMSTLAAGVRGTPGYMAPELESSSAARPSQASDVYSAGCLLRWVVASVSGGADREPLVGLENVLALADRMCVDDPAQRPLATVCAADACFGTTRDGTEIFQPGENGECRFCCSTTALVGLSACAHAAQVCAACYGRTFAAVIEAGRSRLCCGMCETEPSFAEAMACLSACGRGDLIDRWLARVREHAEGRGAARGRREGHAEGHAEGLVQGRRDGEEAATASAIADDANVKRCPGCDALCTRIEGCRHMTCPCGHEFWWCCLAAFQGYDSQCGCPMFAQGIFA